MDGTRQEVRFITDGAPLVEISELNPHPDNPNVGSVSAIAESIEENGFYGAVIVQKSTRRVLAGWHRVSALKLLGETRVPVEWADVDDAAALKILAADNQLTRLGHFDTVKLADVLEQISGTATLVGSGFTNDDLAAMLRDSGRYGDRAGGFLGDDDEGDDDPADRDRDPDPTGGDDAPRWFVLSFSVSQEQRDEVQRAIREAKSRLGDSRDNPVTSAEAIYAVCHWWLNGD